MANCSCGYIIFPVGSKYNPDGLSIDVEHDSGKKSFKLVHDKEAILSYGNTFITSTSLINEEISNITNITIKSGPKFSLNLENIINVTVKLSNSEYPIHHQVFGSNGQLVTFKNADGYSKISLNTEIPAHMNLLNHKLVFEFYSVCLSVVPNCCDKLPSISLNPLITSILCP